MNTSSMVSKIHHGVEQRQILLWYAYKLVMDVSGGNSMTLANEILEDCYTRIHALDPFVLETKWLKCYVGLLIMTWALKSGKLAAADKVLNELLRVGSSQWPTLRELTTIGWVFPSIDPPASFIQALQLALQVSWDTSTARKGSEVLYHYLAEIKEGLGWPIFDLIKVYTCPDNGSRMHMLSGFQRSAEIAVFTLIGLNYESAK